MLIKASEIKPGVQLAEADGFLWDVTEIIKETPKTITVRLNSDFSSFKKHWYGNPGITKTFRKTSVLHGVA
jgi:hypothetical protein